ncbi:NPP1 protein [Phytophthora nicotianae]|nr:hypothetical protein AM588_10001151 [Phytophthora nicotianae]KUF99195.1 NPP1 protein [Phytophthora nicotianae]
MNIRALATTLFTLLFACAYATVDHDKVEPLPQPEAVTVSEKAAIKFKPQLYIPEMVCVSYPAVNAAGEVTGGLKGTNGNDACKYAPQGSQVYGRAGWYKDLWAIMYAWYFPKGFWLLSPSRRHDWKSVVVWIDDPTLETPKIVGVSMSKSDSRYHKTTKMRPSYFAGYQRLDRKLIALPVRELSSVSNTGWRYVSRSNTSLRMRYYLDLGTPYLNLNSVDGEYQDLVMWEQLPDAARAALNDSSNFGKAEVPFNDEHYEEHLDNAWPL